MAGTVLRIEVGGGDYITPGQTVVILESMKMEIPIESTSEGKVNELKVSVGDFVKEGDLLITFL